MYKFHFKYQSLLQIKQQYEDLWKSKFNKAQTHLRYEIQHLKTLKEHKQICCNALQVKASKGIYINDLKTYNGYFESLNKKIDRQKEIIQDRGLEVNHLKGKLILAAKERKIFEKLKEREKEKFYCIQKKQEEDFVDQLVTYKNFRKN